MFCTIQSCQWSIMSFNCANIEMLKWQILHQRILWPLLMEYCGLTDIIRVFLFAQDVGCEALATKPYTDTDVLLASNWRTQKQLERWPIALSISLAQTLKSNRFWRNTSVINAEVNTWWTELQGRGNPPTYTLDKFWARRGIFCTVFPCQICMSLHKIYLYALDQAWGQNGWILAEFTFFFAFLWTEMTSQSIKK